MPDDRLSRLRKGYAEDDCLGLEPPDLGPIRALAETAEFAEAEARLADAYGRPLPADDPLAPLARDIARALTEAGFALHHCAQSHPRYRLGGVCLVPVARATPLPPAAQEPGLRRTAAAAPPAPPGRTVAHPQAPHRLWSPMPPVYAVTLIDTARDREVGEIAAALASAGTLNDGS